MLSLVESIRLRFPKDSLPTGMDWEALPLFPDAYATSPEPQIADTLALRIQSVSKAINFISPRVGASDEVKVVGARMMRYTVGTRLAFKERATKEEIAHVLLHTNPDSCEAYIGVATDLLGAGFNQLYGEEFRRLANRCLNIVDDSDDDPTARGAVIRYSENGKYRPGIGRCGDKSCYHEGPIECYTCEQFRPWLRAPHQLVLNHLNQKRELMAKIDPTRTGDFDAVIIRVMLVIDACDRILAERSS
jgi:hypothetical protein